MLLDKTFWDYAVKLYGKSGVADICLRLQDELSLNVNLILLLCYAEQQRLQLSGEDIDKLVQSIDKWHLEYTKPLRAIRRRLALDDRANPQAKQSIFDAEMSLEKIEQRILVGVYNQLNLSQSDKPQNLQRYIGRFDKKAPISYADAIEYLRATIK